MFELESPVVEIPVPGDEFHDTLASLNALYGKGEVVSITWSRKQHRDELNGVLRREGMVVCEQQYGMSAHPFLVRATDTWFRVHYRSHQRSVRSDYFFDTF